MDDDDDDDDQIPLMKFRRNDGLQDFDQSFESFKNGFGNAENSHFVGLENLHLMTSGSENQLLRVELTTCEGNAYFQEFLQFKVCKLQQAPKLVAWRTLDQWLWLRDDDFFNKI